MNIESYIREGSYAGLMAMANQLPISRFIISPGMGFGDTLKWWAAGTRPSPHNGIDLLGYGTDGGGEAALGAGAAVPLIAQGIVVGIIPDYIAKSIAVEHAAIDGMRLMSLYGHVELLEGIAPGQRLDAGHIIGRVARNTKSPVPAHLHLSLALVADGMTEITWEALEQRARFIDPLPYL